MKSKVTTFLVAALLPLYLLPQSLLDPNTQQKFKTALPVPRVLDVRKGGTFTLPVTQFTQTLGLRNPVTGKPLKTTVWGYGGSYPGPTILARKDVPVQIYYPNRLVAANGTPLPHLLPVDASIHWALMGVSNWRQAGVPIVTHLHGGHTESASDGLPEAWYTPGFTLKGRDFVKGDVAPYRYDNDQEAATIWYHDHALGITRLNVFAGLAGFYILTDELEQQLKRQGKLPADPYDIGLAIQDRMFTATGQLYYPSQPEMPNAPNPSVLPEFFGNFILVNGAIWPVLKVEPRPYRFRILNGSDSRFYNLAFSTQQDFVQVGGDNGFLPFPAAFKKILLGTGERKDVVVDFSQYAGQTIIMTNDAPTPFPGGAPITPGDPTAEIMAFKVELPLNRAVPKSSLPHTEPLRPPLPTIAPNLPTRKLILFEAEDIHGRLKPMLGTADAGVIEWDKPITENPALNSTEIWEIYNQTADAHPIHLHLVRMQLLNRQNFTANTDLNNGKPTNINLMGTPVPPGPEEAGWKDTYVMYPNQVTRVVATFDRPGLYAWHCHILSHEDYEMMRPYFVGQIMEAITRNKAAAQLLEEIVQLQVLPNPFSSHLQVQLVLPKAAVLAMNIYDAKGSLLERIYQGTRHAGPQQFALEGSNLSNGVYFLELVVDGQRMMRKLVLQK